MLFKYLSVLKFNDQKIYIALIYNSCYKMKPIVPKKYYVIYQNVSRNKVLEVLFRYPEKAFSLSDLAKEANVAKANIGIILKATELLKKMFRARMKLKLKLQVI